MYSSKFEIGYMNFEIKEKRKMAYKGMMEKLYYLVLG